MQHQQISSSQSPPSKPIKVMPDALASRVAAGEVVERPASVVKELIENSLDSGASRIHIEIEGGGLKLVRVTDDGYGIPSDQLPTAFQRFATSKVDESSDLIAIPTLGFRGEALPSIAAVADVTARSRFVNADHGTECNVSFGSEPQTLLAGVPIGTSMQVRQLFRNVPARRKFLASPATESARIAALTSQIALIRSDIKFRLVIDGNIRLDTPGDFDDAAALSAVHKIKEQNSIITLSADMDAAFSAHGAVVLPNIHYGRRTQITIAVNGRLVQNYRLTFAVERAYQGFLPEKRFPIALIKVNTPLEDVDVNVHPAKTEVRFRREGLVFSVIENAVRDAISTKATVREFSQNRIASSLATSLESAFAKRRMIDNQPPAEYHSGYSTNDESVQKPPDSKQPGKSQNPPPKSDQTKSAQDAQPQPNPRHRDVLTSLRVLGQAQQTYIVAEDSSGVFLIDQHAAHERVKYEEIRTKHSERANESQPLLSPQIIELTAQQQITYSSCAQWFQDAGWHIEPFGDTSLMLRAVPQVLAERRALTADAAVSAFKQIIDEMADYEDQQPGRASADQMSSIDRLLATMACHSAIRAGDLLTMEECKEIVHLLEQCEHPQSCPHGRPTMLMLSGEALEREFGRR